MASLSRASIASSSAAPSADRCAEPAFFFLAFEGVRENFQRPNLSDPIGTPCPVSAPTLAANEALIAGSADCQRLALLQFFRTRLNQDEGQPIDHKINNNALLGKIDWNVSPANNLSASYNFNYSKNTNQTFDVPTYGTSANGIEGPSKINVFNLNLFSTLGGSKLNELHVTFSRENRPRSAIESSVPADTAIGFGTTFRFGNPFFIAPNIDEVVKRVQVKDNLSMIRGKHTFKAGFEWIHTNNVQVFRGFFKGRYIFDSVHGLPALRVASGAGRVRAVHGRLLERLVRHRAGNVPGRHDAERRSSPLLPAEQQSGRRRSRRGGLLRHQQRRVRAVHPGQMAGRPRADDRLRPSLGCAADARNGRSAIHGVRAVPERPALSVGRHHSRSVEAVSAASRVRLGYRRRTADPSFAAAPASTMPGRTCSPRSDR